MRIRGDAHGLSGWDCWECQAPGTPIFHHIRTPGVVFATGSPADLSRLGVTFSAYSSQLRTDSVRIGRSSTGSDYCLVAWGGPAAIVGLVGIALFPLDSYCYYGVSATSTCGLKSRAGYRTGDVNVHVGFILRLKPQVFSSLFIKREVGQWSGAWT